MRGGGENEPCIEGYAVWGCGEYILYCCDGDKECPGANWVDVSDPKRLCVMRVVVPSIPPVAMNPALRWLATDAYSPFLNMCRLYSL